MPRKKAATDPADMLMDLPSGIDLDTIGREPPKRTAKTPAKRKPAVTVKVAGAFIDAIESVAVLFGHEPDEAERNAAVAGLIGAARKSPAVAGFITGSQSAQEWGAIVVGLGGLVARIGLDVAVTRNESMQPVRERVYMGTTLAYSVFGVGGPVDFSPLMGDQEPEPEVMPDAGLETRGTRSNHRSDGFGQDLASAEASRLP